MATSAAIRGIKPSAAAALALLETHPAGVSSLDALDGGAGFRLSGRILELRQAGYPIETTWETTSGGSRIARYRLAPAGQLRMAM